MQKATTNNASEGWNPQEAKMSFFSRPITNKRPAGVVTLFEVYQMTITPRYRAETKALRAIMDKEEQRAFKCRNLDYVTPSGLFSHCSDNALCTHSGMLCMDLDELDDRVGEVRGWLLADPQFETLLLFRSPRGNGLKWFVAIDLGRCDHRTWFAAIRNYLMATYGLTERQVDGQCCNPSRACYLCHDPEAYLKTSLIEHF